MSTRRSIRILPSVEYLRECFTYSPESGEIRWRPRPRGHFASVRGWKTSNTRFTGTLAGAPTDTGYGRYYCVCIDYQRHWVHRVIWKWMTGEDPLRTIDHKDGNRLNNRWENLRAATPTEQMFNQGLRKDNTTGHRGTYRNGNRWQAKIYVNGIQHHLGSFTTREEASAAYEAAAREWHGEFYRHPRNYIPVSS